MSGKGRQAGKRQAKQWLGRLMDRAKTDAHRSGLRCLMYHSIVSEPAEDPDQMTTPLALFHEHMAFLAAEGYRVEAADDVLRRWSAGNPVAPNTVVLTFDDGFADNYRLAYPVLCRHRFPATFFVVTAALDGGCGASPYLWRESYFSWAEAREMQASGLIQFGCHSATHRNLRGLPPVQLRDETSGAKRRLEDGLGREVELFAYPFGSYGSWDSAAKAALRQAGFRGAFTTVFGGNRAGGDPFQLRRSRVSWSDDLSEFRRLLRGAYDWYAWVQLLQTPRARLVGQGTTAGPGGESM